MNTNGQGRRNISAEREAKALLIFSITILAAFGAFGASSQVPVAFTQTAGPVRGTSATLNGMAVPAGVPATAWFEWGTDRTYGNITAPQNVGAGTHVVRVAAAVSGLFVSGVYHFRLVCSNAFGVSYGFDSMFTTAMKAHNWGSFSDGLPSMPAGLTNLSGIASGHRHCIGIRNDGTVVAWTVATSLISNRGQTNVPAGLSNVVAVAGGFSHCLALKEDSTVVAWGRYGDNTPVDVPADLTNVIAISGGDFFSAALKANGTVVAWGKNGSYTGATNVPPGLVDVVAISCGSGHTLALMANGTVNVWGGDPGAVPAPASATNLVAVTTMGYWNMALRADGTVLTWGGSLYPDVPQPANVTNVAAIATGYGYVEVLKQDGTLLGWGRGIDATNIPPGLSNVVAFASGDGHRVGLAPVNLPPKSFDRTVPGAINKASSISLVGIFLDPEADSISYRIESLPAKGTLYHHTDSGLGAAITAPGTPVPAPFRVFFVPEVDAFGAPYDSFGVVGNDGELDSPPATLGIAVVPAPQFTYAAFTNNPPGAFVLRFTGWTNVSYSVYRSTDLGSWAFIGVATQAAGQFSFIDSTANNASTRYYRLRYP